VWTSLPAVVQLGGNVRYQLHLQQGNVILELKLSFFEAAQLQVVVPRVMCQKINDGIQVAVFDLQFDNTSLNFFVWNHGTFWLRLLEPVF
jgi:hypothetical protein